MNIRSIFTEPPKLSSLVYRYYRYPMLIAILLLLALHIQWYVTLPPGYHYDPYRGFVVVLMLLFNHLAFLFKWPPSVTVILRILALSWTVFGLFYAFYLSRVLYP